MLPTKNDLAESLKNVATKDDVEELKQGMASVNQEIDSLRAENKELKERVLLLERELLDNDKNAAWIEKQIPCKKLVFRGLKKQRDIPDAVAKVLTDKLNIAAGGVIVHARKIAEHNGTMHVVAEFDSEKTTSLILKNKKKLAGTNISVEKDLGPRKQRNKKVLLYLRKKILSVSVIYSIGIEGDRMRIGDKWLSFNQQRQLVCGNQSGEDCLKELYGDIMSHINLDYQHIITQEIQKN